MENTQSEELSMEDLKSKALLYGIQFPGNISKLKLFELVSAVENKKDIQEVGVEVLDEDDDAEFDESHAFKTRITRKDAKELKEQALMMIKIRVTNLSPDESDEQNVYAGVISNYFKAARYVPFDTDWYVEQCLVDKLMTEKLQVFVNEIDPNTRRPNGNKQAKLVKHYNVQYVR